MSERTDETNSSPLSSKGKDLVTTAESDIPAQLPVVVDPTVIRIERRQGWLSLKLRDLWEYRELLYFLVWRDVKVRYKQTALGAAWAVLQPLMTMTIFTVIFGGLAQIPSDGIPYPIFTFTALLPWNYFSGALSRATNSVVGNAQLVSKVYFPRLIIPLSAVVSGVIDFGVAFIVLLGMMLYYGIAPTWHVLALPLFLLLATLTAI